eukprot:GFUD01014431.1.p1 GENE.GFUD01014431.1~~GFUD01014431.1.p1  ORF type:complete len:706 (+),score=95.53 GFUD01014431.1:848-2965(+)
MMEKRNILREEVGKVFQGIRQQFVDTSWIEREKIKIRKAIIFEVNKRFIQHPFDLRGLRHARFFQECLYDYLDRIENPRRGESWYHKISSMFISPKLKDLGRRLSPTKRFLSFAKVVFLILTTTILVAGFDYYTDFVVLKIFWNIGKMTLENYETMDDFSKFIVDMFQGSATILLMIFFFSLIFVFFQAPSIWYQYQVKTAMCKSEFETGILKISPEEVVNQYNLSIMESGTESIWQMLTQWGSTYFNITWLLTWIMSLSPNVHDKLILADSELKFSVLYSSLVSSLFSLSMAQSKMRMVLYEYRTSSKQKVGYLICALLNTTSIFLLFVNWYTSSADLFSLSVVASGGPSEGASVDGYSVGYGLGAVIFLITPHLYKFLVLPSSRLNIDLPCYSCPEFFHYLKVQCFIMSFVMFSTATLNCITWNVIGPLATPKLAEFANTISNGTFTMTNISLITPSNAYTSLPFNARQGLLWISMMGIPACWLFSYLGLYFYFGSSECKMRFREEETKISSAPDNEFEMHQNRMSTKNGKINLMDQMKMKLNGPNEITTKTTKSNLMDQMKMKLNGPNEIATRNTKSNLRCCFSALYRRMFLYKTNTEGWWEDINDLSEIADNKIIEEFFSSENDQEREILEDIKKSFSVWRKCKESPLEFPFFGTDSFKNINTKQMLFKCLKYFLLLLGFLLSIVVIGIGIDLFKDIYFDN